MLAMAVVTCALMLVAVRRSQPTEPAAPPRPLGLRLLVADAGLILGRTSIYLAFNALYLVTLALTTSYAPGDATVLSYAYLFSSYLVAGTAFALGMSRIADMSREVRADELKTVGGTVPQGFRYSILICAPALAAFVAAGAPIIGVLFSASFDSGDVRILQEFGTLLAIWTVAALLVNLLLPAMFALGRARFTNLLTPALVAVHVAASLLGGALFGAVGVVGAAFVAPLLFAATMLRVGAPTIAGHLARETSRDALRFLLLAGGCYGLGAALGAALDSTVVGAMTAGAVGSVLYLALLPLVAPSQVEVVLRALPLGALRARSAALTAPR